MQKTIVIVSVTVLLTTLILVSGFMFVQNNQRMDKDVDIQESVDEMVERQEEEFVKSEVVDDLDIDTSDWLTYTDKKHNFSFKYPAECELLESKNTVDLDCNFRKYFAGKEISEDIKFLGNMTIDYGDLRMEQYLEEQLEMCLKDSYLPSDKEFFEIIKLTRINNNFAVKGGCYTVGDPDVVAIFNYNSNNTDSIEIVGYIRYGFEMRKDPDGKASALGGHNIASKIYETLKFD